MFLLVRLFVLLVYLTAWLFYRALVEAKELWDESHLGCISVVVVVVAVALIIEACRSC